MAAVRDVVAYIIYRSPIPTYPREKPPFSSVLRVVQLVYLTDWRSAITRERTLTDCHWVLDERLGPLDPKVVDVVLFLQTTEDRYIRSKVNKAELLVDERDILDFVLHSAQGKSNEHVTKLVNSTYPVLSGDTAAALDLVSLARKYSAQRRLLVEV